jgi:hypothetical protein
MHLKDFQKLLSGRRFAVGRNHVPHQNARTGSRHRRATRRQYTTHLGESCKSRRAEISNEGCRF